MVLGLEFGSRDGAGGEYNAVGFMKISIIFSRQNDFFLGTMAFDR